MLVGRMALGLARAREFAPTMLGPDLLAWWDYRRGITAQGGPGSLVSAWADAVNGWTLTQPTGVSQPILALNGVLFDGVNDFLEADSTFGLPVGSDPCEIWCLFTAGGAGTLRVPLAWGGSVNNEKRIVRLQTTDVGAILVGNGVGTVTKATTNTTTGRHFLRTQVTSTNETIAEPDTTTLLSPTAVVPATGATETTIGALNNTGAQPFNGTLSHILVADLLTDAQAAALGAWLGAQL